MEVRERDRGDNGRRRVVFLLLSVVVAQQLWATAAAPQSDDDFGFDVADDDLVVDVASESVEPPLHRLWGVPDLVAVSGKIFHFTIPSDAFSEPVKYFEAQEKGSDSLPNWLIFDKSTGTLHGVPSSKDIGDTTFTIRAVKDSSQHNNAAYDEFVITVTQTDDAVPNTSGKEIRCGNRKETVLNVIVDAAYEHLKPKQRIVAIENLARFLGLHFSAFKFVAQSTSYDLIDNNSIILAGPGDSKKTVAKHRSALRVIVGCDGTIMTQFGSVIAQLKEQARDGTISEVIGLPTIGWRVSIEAAQKAERKKRQAIGEGADFDLSDYGDLDDEDDEDVGVTEPSVTRIVPEISTEETTTPVHPHRHHHGEDRIEETPILVHHKVTPIIVTVDVDFLPTLRSTTVFETTVVTEATTTEPKTERTSTTTERNKNVISMKNIDYDDDEDDYDDLDSETELPSTPAIFVAPKVPTTISTTTTTTTQSTTVPTTIMPTTMSTTEKTVIVTEVDTEMTTMVTSPSTTPTPTSTSTLSTSTEVETTEPTEEDIKTTLPSVRLATITEETMTTATSAQTTISSTTISSTEPTTLTTIEDETTTAATVARTASPPVVTEDLTPRNLPPIIKQRLKKFPITAGKMLSYIIPEDTFVDPEGEQLHLSFLESDGSPVKRSSWIQFNHRTREVYGLPLENQVSKWEYQIQATDRMGASVSDRLEITVQHHKGRRTVNHEFTMYLRFESDSSFSSTVDWQIKVLKELAALYKNPDPNQITVTNVNMTSNPILFTWTNDTLPRSHCPKTEIDSLLSVLVTDNDGIPSWDLQKRLQPELRVKKVESRGVGPCETHLTTPPPPVVIKVPASNFSPVPRNQIDHINATVGKLLLFRVPEDTFYDPEDHSARNLKMSLLMMDSQPIPSNHWLQFDSKNQEFYGIPLAGDRGRTEYLLVCEDSGGLTANDALVVTVNSRPATASVVEFSMTIDVPYESFASSASMKRKFIEKLVELFGDSNADSIVIDDVSEGSTIVGWTNSSLPTDKCPDSEIARLRRILIDDEDDTVSERVEDVMGPEFVVVSVALQPVGVCQGEKTVIHPPEVPPLGNEETKAAGAHDDYLITFVLPAVIISCMILLASIVACVLYRRRRRSGKLNVGDEERRSLRTKGIPVIFQDELDDKPEPGNKTPIIMKEEKPPLPPPEYNKRGESPEEEVLYKRPPPPFPSSGDGGRSVRPKVTPEYRKPPPYVPP